MGMNKVLAGKQVYYFEYINLFIIEPKSLDYEAVKYGKLLQNIPSSVQLLGLFYQPFQILMQRNLA